jgi:hypothetical protein
VVAPSAHHSQAHARAEPIRSITRLLPRLSAPFCAQCISGTPERGSSVAQHHERCVSDEGDREEHQPRGGVPIGRIERFWTRPRTALTTEPSESERHPCAVLGSSRINDASTQGPEHSAPSTQHPAPGPTGRGRTMLTLPVVGPDLDRPRRSVRWQVALQAMGHGRGTVDAPRIHSPGQLPPSWNGAATFRSAQDCEHGCLLPSWGRLPPIAPGGPGWIDP